MTVTVPAAGRGEAKECVRQLRRGADMTAARLGIADDVPCSTAAMRVDHLVQGRKAADPRDVFRAVLQSDQCPKQWHTRHKRLGPIDRIENPTESARAGCHAKLLPEDRIIREAVPDAVGEQPLRPAIREGHRRLVGLPLHAERGILIVPSNEPRRLGVDSEDEVQTVGDGGVRHELLASERYRGWRDFRSQRVLLLRTRYRIVQSHNRRE